MTRVTEHDYLEHKNAVQRLQKLENDIKTVISIYEAAKSSTVKNDETETENEAKSQLSSVAVLPNKDKSKWGLTDKCTSAFEHFRKLANFSPRLGNAVHLSPEKKNDASKKPSSAPSTTSTGTVCESDYLWQPTSDSNNAKWIDFSDSYNLLMTPSKTLQVADEVLSKYNFQTDHVECENLSKAHKNKEKDCVCSGQKIEISNDSKVITKEILQKKKTEKQSKVFAPTNYVPNLTKKEFFPNAKLSGNETASDISQKHHLNSKKIPRIVKERLENFEIKNREKISSFNPSKRAKSLVRKNHASESASSEKINSRGQERSTSGDNVEKEKTKTKIEQKSAKKVNSLVKSLSAQKIHKGEEDGKLSAIEMFKIIEKSNEKLEKMQISKELALDIAAQLKEKHEEMRRSKEDMMKKLQKLEMDNERLSVEIKDAREKKRKLQLKMEGFCSYSKTKLLKQDLRSKEILEENEWLKTCLKELEKKYNEDYIEKLAQIDKTQKERLTEIKNELKIRETRAEEEIKKLIYEKSKLLEKVEELQSCLHERQSKEESLEEKICALEDEVERQKLNLKKKSDKLEETHKELEVIRQNSELLEEQVKTLRTNIENFDQMQKNLMTGIEDRESQIKSSRTEIERLQLENASLKKEVEKEKDIVLIKDKIIEDQQETIKQLREKSEEAKTLMKRNQSLERLLSREREEKLELQEAVECLKMKKEELKKKIKSLEADLLLAPEEVVRDLQKTQMVLHELENQVHVKQREWEHHLQLLIKEKEQACSVAEFATKKLMQTTSKFQKQSEAHKKLHQVLAENLAEKERHLRETLSRGSCLQVKPNLSDNRPEMKRSSRQLYTRECISGNNTGISTNNEWQPKKMFAVEDIRPEESPYFF